MEDSETTTHYYLECDTDPAVEWQWHWGAKSTKLLVDLYVERQNRFRDPKKRKRALWTEIVDEMERAGYKGINEDICDRKLRNMKKTYRTCKETMRRSGRKRVAWEYFDTFDELFQHERLRQFEIKDTDVLSIPDESVGEIETSLLTQQAQASDTRVPALSASSPAAQDHQRQLLILERNRIAAIRELSKRISESNTIQRERNELLREYLSQL